MTQFGTLTVTNIGYGVDGMRYTVVIEKTAEGYLVKVPALPGCLTDGDTLEEAYEMAKDAVQGHVDALRTLGRSIPKDVSVVHVDATVGDEWVIRRVEVDLHAASSAYHG